MKRLKCHSELRIHHFKNTAVFGIRELLAVAVDYHNYLVSHQKPKKQEGKNYADHQQAQPAPGSV